MILDRGYLMEGDDEALRLDIKTDAALVEEQALWAGIKPGMRIADLGCGAGKTTFHLNQLVQPDGQTVGVDIGEQRIEYAKKHYNEAGIEYVTGDIRQPLDQLGLFDFIWIRFVLEYYLKESFDIVKNISQNLKPGGILCLIDLDCNCLRNFGLSRRLENAMVQIMKKLEIDFNFDPYVGLKLYSYVFDLGYEEIDVKVTPHNLIYGDLREKDSFNWTKKVEIAARQSGFKFDEFEGGYEEFFEEFKEYFSSQRRFTYTPMIWCRGCRS
ncbi:MAG: class I SAM-dependent methyltransferase [Desulfobacterales bacterium]|nr:MAG: class I SAM-dependent methyltransferase [Desulfobacterales bacterium]